jgi:hypothetical protein
MHRLRRDALDNDDVVVTAQKAMLTYFLVCRASSGRKICSPVKMS